MTQRKYSVDEIDRMRAALIKRHPIDETFTVKVGFFDQPSKPSEATYQRRAERSAIVERELRTYMLNGTDPGELCRETIEPDAGKGNPRRA